MGSETIANIINSQEWVDRVGDPLQEFVRTTLRSTGPLKDLLHGVFLGHPLHPVLTDIPVGAWTVALVLDALQGLSGNEQLGAGADAAIGIGLLGAIGSAVTGLADWSETDQRAKKVGLVHGLLNVTATSLYLTSWVMRGRKSQRDSGVALSMLGYAVAGVSAYLGGHLVFAEQIGVDHTATAEASKPEKFVSVMAEADLKEETPTRAEADGVAVLLVKRAGRIFAITETCPHLGGPLAEGKLVGDAIQCPWHQSELALEDGHVVTGPTAFPARCFDVRIRGGKIEVRAASRHASA